MRKRKKMEASVVARLRRLCVLALDERAPLPERQAASMALCKELRKAGFLEDGGVSLPLPEKKAAPTAAVVEGGRVHFRRQVIIEPDGEDRWHE